MDPFTQDLRYIASVYQAKRAVEIQQDSRPYDSNQWLSLCAEKYKCTLSVLLTWLKPYLKESFVFKKTGDPIKTENPDTFRVATDPKDNIAKLKANDKNTPAKK